MLALYIGTQNNGFDTLIIENDYNYKKLIHYLNYKREVNVNIESINVINILDDNYVFIDYRFYDDNRVFKRKYHRMNKSTINNFILSYNRSEIIKNVIHGNYN